MRPTTVTIEGKRLTLPNSLHLALGQPGRTHVVEADGANLFLYPSSASMRLKVLAKNAVGKCRIRTAALEDASGDRASYLLTSGDSLGEGSYNVSNHHPFYYLMPADEREVSASRQATWGGLTGYHEHLDPAAQDASANRISAWLAKDVFAPLGAQSFLEIGCGAGRNLLWLSRTIEDARLHGLDINPQAIAKAKELVADADVEVRSVYELGGFKTGSIEVVYSIGVLEHLPHEMVAGVVQEMHRIASKAVVHFELHGPSHDFDFHRYPRDYAGLYRNLGVATPHEYVVYPDDDFRSTSTNFHYALLTATL